MKQALIVQHTTYSVECLKVITAIREREEEEGSNTE